MKKNILFVDDERNVLQGLRRMLRPLRNEWHMEFAENGPEALERLGNERFDVIVADMRMAGMDGAELLTQVKKRHPEIVRIVLSGHSNQEMIFRSIGPAHQYLAKPCDTETLRNTIGRACALRDLLEDESVKQLVSQLESLPSLPELYQEIVEYLRSPDASIQKVGEIISKDLGMTAKILQLVNSAFFGLPRHISSPAQAASLLGLETIKALVFSVQIFSEFECAKMKGIRLDRLWRHSTAVGAFSRKICLAEKVDDKISDQALMAGMMHDIGKLVMAKNIPEGFVKVKAVAAEQRIPPWQAEREVFGATHGEIGAYLLGLWGFPDPIIEALAYHHHPRRCPNRSFAPLTAVHVANALSQEIGNSSGQEETELDMEYLEALHITERLHVWRDKCMDEEAEVGD